MLFAAVQVRFGQIVLQNSLLRCERNQIRLTFLGNGGRRQAAPKPQPRAGSSDAACR